MRSKVILVFLLVAGCTPSPDEEALTAAKGAVTALLTDPASAQFREVKAYPAGDKPVAVCGEVNAKNRMGGYNGFQRFIFRVASNKVDLSPNADQQILVDPLIAGTRAAEFDVNYIEVCSNTSNPTFDLGNGVANGTAI